MDSNELIILIATIVGIPFLVCCLCMFARVFGKEILISDIFRERQRQCETNNIPTKICLEINCRILIDEENYKPNV